MIPAEVVDIIFQLLSDLDRACFALSCKRLHACYVSYNRQRGIGVLSTLPKTLLLRRLQNERWVYCCRCQNLHQYSKWQFLQFGWRCAPKPAISKCNAWCDVQHNDRVDICPCSSITFHQKQHPTEYFRSQSETLRHSDYLIWHVYTSLHCSASSSIGGCPNSSSIQRNFQDFPGGESVCVPGFQRKSFVRALPKDQL